jgi:hypothetical protein
MIHTDGTPTIANCGALERAQSAAVPPVNISYADGEELLRRDVAGCSVTLHYFANNPVLRVTDAEGEHSVIVPRAEALDAFWHPYLYIAR